MTGAEDSSVVAESESGAQSPLAAYDEMYRTDGAVRPGLEPLHRVLADLGRDGLRERGRLRDAHLSAQGITFTLSGRERPLPMDLVPRVVTAAEWDRVAAGVSQRIRALEAFLADVYGPGDIMRDGVVPKTLVTSSHHFHRSAHGINPPNGVRIHVSGVDLIRDDAGVFHVLEDNLRNPSGVSYVLENRRTLAHVLPEVFAGYQVQPVAEYPERLYRALRAAAPRDVHEPTIVVLTPGVHNAAHFEHAYLARLMGVELVEGRDLFCRSGFVFMRTTRGAEPVHVIYRRIDDDFLDPVHFRPDSVLGIPGILNSARSGAVTLANGVGNGVADDKALYPYVPKLIEYYLGEKAIIPNVPTYDLRDPDVRRYVLERLDHMVCKPADASGGYGLVIGPQATDEQLVQSAVAIEGDPRSWIAQPVINLSTCPTVVGSGQLAARHIDLRPFAVNDGRQVWVMPGGLTRVALAEGSLVVNSSQGGGSKDTWVLADTSQAVPSDIDQEGEAAGSGLSAGHGPRESNHPVGGGGMFLGRSYLPPISVDRLVQQSRQQQQQPDSASGSHKC